MSSKKLKNIPLKLFRDFLKDQGCNCTRSKGGHEHWTREDLRRPITIQMHIDSISEFIIKKRLLILGHSKQDFLDWI